MGVFTHGLTDLAPGTIGYVRGTHGIPVEPPEGAKIMAVAGGSAGYHGVVTELLRERLQDDYEHWLDTEIGLNFGSSAFSMSIHHWINEALMAMFFLVIGLELKRELLVGELPSLRQALLPIMAAVGGMVVPALFYLAFNSTGPGVVGWGIPMATDIAFAVGALSLLGSRVPKTLVTFLIALAIVDDLGAVADLGFASQPQDLLMAKTGILLASAIAGIGGISWLLANTKKTASGEP